MSRKETKKPTKSGTPIRGQIAPFRSVLNPVLDEVYDENGLEIFREHMKDAIALRMQHTLYTQVQINQECIEIIHSHFGDTPIFSFIRCALKYYSNTKEHKISGLDTSCPSCSSKDAHKSLQHARKDCIACGKHYIKCIKKGWLLLRII